MNDRDLYGEVDPYTWVTSSIGNVFFYNISFRQLWMAVEMAKTPQQLDAAIKAVEDLNEIVYPHNMEIDSNEQLDTRRRD